MNKPRPDNPTGLNKGGFMCFIFHKWTKWEQYVVKGMAYPGILSPKTIQGKAIPYTERRQRRHCEICNKEQDELIYE